MIALITPFYLFYVHGTYPMQLASYWAVPNWSCMWSTGKSQGCRRRGRWKKWKKALRTLLRWAPTMTKAGTCQGAKPSQASWGRCGSATQFAKDSEDALHEAPRVALQMRKLYTISIHHNEANKNTVYQIIRITL